MPRYRTALPQLEPELFLTDGGLETVLVFHHDIDLPAFASFPLLDSAEGRALLRQYYELYARGARDAGLGAVLDTPTWRANTAWGEKLGYGPERLADVNRRAVELVAEVRDALGEGAPLVVAGCVGPRYDGYVPGRRMSLSEAQDYHAPQIETFARTEVDLVSAMTVTTPEEGIGVTRAAAQAEIPCAISFTLETDGKLPSGHDLGEAIMAVDAATGEYPVYFGINCAHPTHFEHVLSADAPWIRRLRGLRVNASRMSHAELDESTELDAGNPGELGEQMAELRARLPWLNVLGGCCGTDHRHIAAIGRACLTHP